MMRRGNKEDDEIVEEFQKQYNQSTKPQANKLVISALIILVFLFATFVWPTPYKYFKAGELNIRVNRVTGAAEVLCFTCTPAGWIKR